LAVVYDLLTGVPTALGLLGRCDSSVRKAGVTSEAKGER
jgi:hypothetical protein